jgi:hypothetical protein
MLVIKEELLETEESVDEVLTEVIKTLISVKLRNQISSKKQRQLMLEKFGRKAFLLPNMLKFPIINPSTGKFDCSLIYAARIRAKQYSGTKPGYREIAAKAEQLYKDNNCGIKLNIVLHTETEKIDIDFMNLIEVLY